MMALEPAQPAPGEIDHVGDNILYIAGSDASAPHSRSDNVKVAEDVVWSWLPGRRKSAFLGPWLGLGYLAHGCLAGQNGGGPSEPERLAPFRLAPFVSVSRGGAGDYRYRI